MPSLYGEPLTGNTEASRLILYMYCFVEGGVTR